MKKISHILLLLFSIGVLFGCKQADEYYLNFDKLNVKYDGTIYQYLEHQPGVYDSLMLMLERLPELKEKLKNSNESITYFAVNNRSFELAIENLNTVRKNEGKEPLYIEDIKLEVLDTLAYRYVFDELVDIKLIKPYLDGYVISSSKYEYDMHAQYRVLTASGIVGGGEQQIVFSDVNESIYERYWQRANTKAVDLQTDNGFVQTLSSQHDFGFGKLNDYFTNKK